MLHTQNVSITCAAASINAGTVDITGETSITGNLNVSGVTTSSGLNIGAGGGEANFSGNIQHSGGTITSEGVNIGSTHKHTAPSGGGQTSAPL